MLHQFVSNNRHEQSQIRGECDNADEFHAIDEPNQQSQTKPNQTKPKPVVVQEGVRLPATLNHARPMQGLVYERTTTTHARHSNTITISAIIITHNRRVHAWPSALILAISRSIETRDGQYRRQDGHD